jgi:virulence-associated protein VagC
VEEKRRSGIAFTESGFHRNSRLVLAGLYGSPFTARTAGSDTPPNARAKIFSDGRSQAVRLPREFRFEGKEVAIRKEGEAILFFPRRHRQARLDLARLFAESS